MFSKKLISLVSAALFSSNPIYNDSHFDSPSNTGDIQPNPMGTGADLSGADSFEEKRDSYESISFSRERDTLVAQTQAPTIDIHLDDFMDDDSGYSMPQMRRLSNARLNDALYLHPSKLLIEIPPEATVQKTPQGYLEMRMGPMFSGKTTALIETYHFLRKEGRSTVVINYAGDTRYSDSSLMSHDKVEIPCIFAKTLGEVWYPVNAKNALEICEEIRNADAILINEAQFFPDIFSTVLDMVDMYGKTVYLYGLDGDFQRQPFVYSFTLGEPKTGWLDLIPYADSIKKQRAVCKLCLPHNKEGCNNAIFSHRLTEEMDQIVIGSDNYIPLCRSCYLSQIMS